MRFVLRRRKSPGREDVAGFVVSERGSGKVVHREHFETAALSDRRAANRIVRRRERLERRFPPGDFEIEGGMFNSVAAFEHFLGD